MKILKVIFFLITLCTVILCVGLSFWLYHLNQDIQHRLQSQKFASPVKFFASPTEFFAGQKISFDEILSEFQQRDYRKRLSHQPVLPGDYTILTAKECLSKLPDMRLKGLQSCVVFRKKSQLDTPYIIAFGSLAINTLQEISDLNISIEKTAHHILQIYGSKGLIHEGSIQLEPQVFAQYYGNQSILRQITALSYIPLYCLNAVLAIEDAQFLDHQGISLTGIARATIKNILAGRILQGGSTITQQLVKNYFLTSQRTFKRKLTEIAMAFLLEYRAKKDEILEMYLNVVYMGQLGSFEIRGFQMASRYYFGKDIQNLHLHECSLLAGMIRSPGQYNPVTQPQKALNRRQIVLDKLLELEFISEDDFQEARNKPLPQKLHITPNRSVSFFVEATRDQIKKLGFKLEEGSHIYTTLNLKAQRFAQESIQKVLPSIEKKALQKSKNKRLEVALVATQVQTGFVQAIVGGRDFGISQFNRAYQSKRPIGSIVKPIVYLTALNQESSVPWTPLSLLEDKKVTIKYPGGSWSPRNYQNRYFQSIPMYYALYRSLNAATAHLGVQIGLNNITQIAQRLGIASDLQPLPSLTLGTWELSAFDVLQAYHTLANLGQYSQLTLIKKIENTQGELIYEYIPEKKQVIDAKAVAQLVSMMEQVIRNGTGRGAFLRGLYFPTAGKTGTTNDTKDAWFAGFSPFHAAVVWVGYDDNTSHGLTGASGALPFWTEYMLQFASQYPLEDFPQVDGTQTRQVTQAVQEALGIPQKTIVPFLELTFLGAEEAFDEIVSGNALDEK